MTFAPAAGGTLRNAEAHEVPSPTTLSVPFRFGFAALAAVPLGSLAEAQLSEDFKLLPTDGESSDYFGASVAIGGDTAIVGASGDDDNGSSSGSAYVFGSVGRCGTTYCGTDQNPNNATLIEVETCDSSSASILVPLSGGPPSQFAYLLVGDGHGTVSQPPGAKGDLCIVGGSCLGRYDKDVGQISAAGTFSTDIQNALSNPCAGAVSITPGATWNFQYWHRQPLGAPATFSEAISVTFR